MAFEGGSGISGVKSISGSFYNIMGLPIQKLYGELKKAVVSILNISEYISVINFIDYMKYIRYT